MLALAGETRQNVQRAQDARFVGGPSVDRFIALIAVVVLAAVWPARVGATDAGPQKDIHLVWMGGNDCPPCVTWRALELPKLQQSAEFKSIRFSYVVKGIRSPVPSRAVLPPEVAPFKEMLDEASGGRAGSPKGAPVVDGQIHDLFQGTRSAEEIIGMITAVRAGTPHPFRRCLKASAVSRKCELAA